MDNLLDNLPPWDGSLAAVAVGLAPLLLVLSTSIIGERCCRVRRCILDMRINLTEDEAAALLGLIDRAIAIDRFLLSPQTRTL